MPRQSLHRVAAVVSLAAVLFVPVWARAAEPRPEELLISADQRFAWTNEMFEPPQLLENGARKMIFATDQKLTPACQRREVVKIVRDRPLLLEQGPGYRLLHHLERWEIDSCGQLVTYLAWCTLDDFHQQQPPRIITGAPALRELLNYKPH
jgi:hypothetical protein